VKLKVRLLAHAAGRYTLLAVLPALLIGALAYKYEARHPNVYQASVTLFVQQPVSSSQGVGGTDVYGSTLLAPTYSDLVTQPVVTQAVDAAMAKQYPGYRIEDHSLATDQKPGATTAEVTLSVQDTDPARAAAAANTVAHVFIKRIRVIQVSRFAADERSLTKQIADVQTSITSLQKQIRDYQGPQAGLDDLHATLDAQNATYQNLLSSFSQFRLAQDAQVAGVEVFSPAAVPTTPIGPHPVRDGLLALAVALLLAVAAIRLFDYFDYSLTDPD
jgi:uncharacterized protein involved in exopolysaccharide biosynthesis